MAGISPTLDCACGEATCSADFQYDAPPSGETRFAFAGQYRRGYRRCNICSHRFGQHSMDMSSLYAGAYVSATYGGGLKAAYARIMALPQERSDNWARVRRVTSFAEGFLGARPHSSQPRLLDVGAGLAVFPARMREAGWDCVALDPDPAAAAHAREVAGVAALNEDFLGLDPARTGRFDAITFNKVLEHVETPLPMLAKACELLAPGGFVYVEVPDADTAAMAGPGREEFFIEHHHVFTAASLAMLAARAGFLVMLLESVEEPSTKFTLRAFLTLASPSKRAA
jgi:SAM-dependent methyltransferase